MRFESRTVDAPDGTERIGAIACWAFGVAWAIWGLTGVLGGATLAVVAIVALVVAVVTAAIAFRASESPRPRRLPADWRQLYNLLVIVEFVAIFLASLALGRSGWPELIPAAICLIVGLHFFPLAGLFDMPTYRWTALALCVIAVVGAALLAPTDSEMVGAIVGLGAAAVIWVTTALPKVGLKSH